MSEKDLKIQSLGKKRWMIGVALVAVAVAGGTGISWMDKKPTSAPSEVSSQARINRALYSPSATQWASLTIESVKAYDFRNETVTEGKIAIDEDRSTPIYSPYAGRVTRLLARPGDKVTQGQPLFKIEAADTVQAQNDFVAAVTAVNKAKSQLELAKIQDKRARDLFEGKAIPLKDYQQAQSALIGAENDMRAADTLLEASRNRLRIFGLNDETITAFQKTGHIDPEITVYAPLAGTVVQRKVGPGQYVATGSSDPVFVIGDLSTVWLTAFVRETDAAKVDVGQDMSFKLMALPSRDFNARITYVSTAIDPTTRRLLVRATIDNPDGHLKPEMFASVTIYTQGDNATVGVPRTALLYEGDKMRLWVARDDKTIELRQVKTGLINGNIVEVLSNLQPGERIVTKGSLFIDRVANAS